MMDDPAKDSLAHQTASPSQASQSAHAAKAVMEAKKRFNTAMEDDVSDKILGIVHLQISQSYLCNPLHNQLLIFGKSRLKTQIP